MAVSITVYDSFWRDLGLAKFTMNADTFKVMLCTSSYTPSRTAHTKRSDITNEVTGTGYSAGGTTLTGLAWNLDTVNHKVPFDADDAQWANSTITARYAVVYKARGGAASADELVAYVDFGADQASNAGLFKVAWNASGILQIQG